MPTFLLGKDAKIYFGAAGADLAAMTEMSNVRDVTLTLEAAEADVTTRANSGWRATAPGLKTLTCDFEMLWNPGDEGFEAIKDAFLGGTTLELAPLDQARDVVGAQGPKGSFSVTKFDRSEPLEEAITVSVTAKLAVFDEWVEIEAP
jgi:TP901-1 family phage major tail protein